MAGEFDMRDGIVGQYAWMKKLLNVPQSFWNQARKIYYFNDYKTNERLVGGYYREFGNFTVLTVPKSGHYGPFNYYSASRSYLDDMINN